MSVATKSLDIGYDFQENKHRCLTQCTALSIVGLFQCVCVCVWVCVICSCMTHLIPVQIIEAFHNVKLYTLKNRI